MIRVGNAVRNATFADKVAFLVGCGFSVYIHLAYERHPVLTVLGAGVTLFVWACIIISRPKP